MTSRFFQQINYSSSTEDSDAELEALQLGENDHAVCITGSGARTLDLLLASPASISSVDFCAPQNHLLRLKMAAYASLDYDAFAELMGLTDAPISESIVSEVVNSLGSESRQYWNEHRHLLKKGVLYCGTWEKLLRLMSKTTWLRRRHVDALLNAPDVESQKAHWKKHWSGKFFRTYLRVLSNRFMWTSIIREPGARLIPPDFDVADYLYNCLEKMASHSLLRENPYANLLFLGRYSNSCKLPRHLRAENFDRVASQIDRIEVFTQSLEKFLGSHERRFDAFSLSDFSSYAPRDAYENTWHEIVRKANDNAKFCERFFLVKRNLDIEQRVRNRSLEFRLQERDHTCLYTFHAGNLISTIHRF